MRSSHGRDCLAGSHDDRHDEQLVVVDQPGPDRLGCKIRTADGDIAIDCAFSCRIASGSKARSIRVLAVRAVSSVLE